MKRFFPMILTVVLVLTLAIAGCGGGNSGGGNPGGGDPGGPTYTPGQQSPAYTVGSVTFYMRYAPNGSFPSDDAAIMGRSTTDFPTTLTVDKAYWIAETEVTYQLWYTVYTWATDKSATDSATYPGHGQYAFGYTGAQGSKGTNHDYPTPPDSPSPDQDKTQPVTYVSWRDAMVWCNALTEYYNAQNGTNLACVYYKVDHSTPLRSVDRNSVSATTKADGGEDSPYVNPNAKGFRLPTSAEWELAARYQDGTNWTPGDHVSGDTSGHCWPSSGTGLSTVFGNYAWWGYGYPGGNCTSTKIVSTAGSSTPTIPCTGNANALGLYDMSGNSRDWCFDWYPGQEGICRVERGGDWGFGADLLQIGSVVYAGPTSPISNLGFRPVKTQ